MTILVALIVFLLVAFPATSPGKRLRELLVDYPARRLNRATRGHVVFYCALGVIGFILFCLFEAEGVRLFSFMAPDLIIWFTVFDVSVFLDVMILGAAMATNARVRGVRTMLARNFDRIRVWSVARVMGRSRATRPRLKQARKAVSDGPDPAGPALAWA